MLWNICYIYFFPKHFSGQYLIQNKRRKKKWNTPLKKKEGIITVGLELFSFFFPLSTKTSRAQFSPMFFCERKTEFPERTHTRLMGNCTRDLLLAVRRACKPPKVQRIVDINIDRSSVQISAAKSSVTFKSTKTRGRAS